MNYISHITKDVYNIEVLSGRVGSKYYYIWTHILKVFGFKFRIAYLLFSIVSVSDL
jgi:hypothetical protein